MVHALPFGISSLAPREEADADVARRRVHVLCEEQDLWPFRDKGEQNAACNDDAVDDKDGDTGEIRRPHRLRRPNPTPLAVAIPPAARPTREERHFDVILLVRGAICWSGTR